MCCLTVRRTPAELRTGAVAFFAEPKGDFRPEYSSLVLFLSACLCFSSAFSAHQEFFIPRIRLCTCALSCLNWAYFEAEFLSLSHAACAVPFCSTSRSISWSHWSNQSWCFFFMNPSVTSAEENIASLEEAPCILELWQLVGLYQVSLLAWLAVHLSHGSSSGSEHSISSLCS